MIPRRPYLIRAMHDWMVDNGETPHLLVDAEQSGVEVPGEFVQNGKIILNISPGAVQGLSLENDFVMFSARFGGRPMEIVLPMPAVLAIYSRESGQGMLFNEEDDGPTADGEQASESGTSDSGTESKKGSEGSEKKPRGKKDPKRPNLRVIK